jgi:uncharacterized membrane protein YvbJ
MTIQEAIETYDAIKLNLPILSVILGVAMLVFGVMGSSEIYNIKKASKFEIGSLIAIFIGITVLAFVMYQEYSVKPKELVEWEETVREEYVNKLSIEKIEVLDYKGIGQKINDNQLKIEFTYLNQNIKTVDTVVATIKPIKNLKAPYLEYQYIEKNVPQNGEEIIFEKGYHNPILYIPE